MIAHCSLLLPAVETHARRGKKSDCMANPNVSKGADSFCLQAADQKH